MTPVVYDYLIVIMLKSDIYGVRVLVLQNANDRIEEVRFKKQQTIPKCYPLKNHARIQPKEETISSIMHLGKNNPQKGLKSKKAGKTIVSLCCVPFCKKENGKKLYIRDIQSGSLLFVLQFMQQLFYLKEKEFFFNMK